MKLYLKTKDFSVTKEAFELFHDEDLDMLITKPKPNNLEKYYESEVYISHTDSKKSLVDKVYQLVKRYSLKKKVKLINSFQVSDKRLLDIGAGTADFLLAAQKAGWKTWGIEPNALAQQNAVEKGVSLLASLNDVAGQKFNVITLWHVLEHLPNLETDIEQICNLLEDDGTLIIAVPNFNSLDANYYKEHWAAFDVPRHLWHFSKTAIEKIFSKNQMRLIKTKPMLFDSFYVSLLSEKYKNGKQNYMKALYIGLKSNLKGKRTKEYSSHIYILKKKV
ncbi:MULTISPECIES: class I SAM-dependent methyltransferase [Croceitalea]|uniref:Class I SAM-dependent methyltransferase n=1 Tax=Croceitalea vernalis TaxID=3075599 RepID=A0ABU3BE92_9FLAO|nr:MULTISPECIES: class I SAM-dependent methyltransferase [unclassified Croceitalea]MDT0538696.1 class I SAM-dependent methyltransferase [Croceitalea sp. P059]MDT0620480.1 class I SAM-dependent methyltransferase [Croceitalea sp. P007]